MNVPPQSRFSSFLGRPWALGLIAATALTSACAEQAQDTIVVGLSADITTFEPGMISSRDNNNIARHIFGSLFRLDAQGNHEPELAHTLEISEDGTAYVYTLREGLTCHDGEPLTADHGGSIRHTYSHAIQGFAGRIPAQAIQGIQNNPNVDFVERDGRVQKTAVASWGLDRIDQRGLPLDGSYSASANSASERLWMNSPSTSTVARKPA